MQKNEGNSHASDDGFNASTAPRPTNHTVDRPLEGMAQNSGDLAPPPRNRRRTDPKTLPTQALANTNTVEESKGLRVLLRSVLVLLRSFLSRIMAKKSD